MNDSVAFGMSTGGASAPEIPPLDSLPLGDTARVSEPLPFRHEETVIGPTGRPMPDLPEPKPKAKPAENEGEIDMTGGGPVAAPKTETEADEEEDADREPAGGNVDR